MIVLDMGSGETCRNDWKTMCRLIEAAASSRPTSEPLILKWQLFTEWRPLLPLDRRLFKDAIEYALDWGCETTASVFDESSLEFLKALLPPFIKIACVPDLYRFIESAREAARVMVSVPDYDHYSDIRNAYPDVDALCCVREYPADSVIYEQRFNGLIHYGLSDHTTDFTLYHRFKPLIWEKHFCLDDSIGPDAGAFAMRPGDFKQLGEI